jgi:hypothetical protein
MYRLLLNFTNSSVTRSRVEKENRMDLGYLLEQLIP